MKKNTPNINIIEKIYEDYLIQLELYKAKPKERKEIYKNIMEDLERLSSFSKSFNEKIEEALNEWKYFPGYNEKYIEILDDKQLLRLILLIANKEKNNYEIKKIRFQHLIPEEDTSEFKLLFGNVLLLSNKETLSKLSKETIYYSFEVTEILKQLSETGNPLVFTSSIPFISDDKLVKERFSSSNGKDIMCSLGEDNILISTIEKIISYISTYGSDFSNLDESQLAEEISTKHSPKKRTLTNQKYYKY